MATIEEILAGTDTRGFGETNQTFDANNIFSSGFGRGANQNYSGILGTDQAQNILNPNIVSAIDAQTVDEQAQLPINPVDNRNIFSRFKDFAAPIAKDIAGRTIASQALGNAGFMLGGLPGALLGTIFGGLKGGGIFNAPYIEGVTTLDPITGQLISGEELDKLNAAGGYYSDIARAARRRDDRIAKMRERQALGKRISEANLARLEEEQAREEAARQAEADRLAAANRATRGTSEATGGYQSSFASDDDFMSGGGTAAEMGSFKQGGIVGLL